MDIEIGLLFWITLCVSLFMGFLPIVFGVLGVFQEKHEPPVSFKIQRTYQYARDHVHLLNKSTGKIIIRWSPFATYCVNIPLRSYDVNGLTDDFFTKRAIEELPKLFAPGYEIELDGNGEIVVYDSFDRRIYSSFSKFNESWFCAIFCCFWLVFSFFLPFANGVYFGICLGVFLSLPLFLLLLLRLRSVSAYLFAIISIIISIIIMLFYKKYNSDE